MSDVPAFAHAPLEVGCHVLPNGLRILTHENHTVPAISLWTFYRVGSRHERPGITGISHLFEHMMFNGARRYGPKEFDRLLESNGGDSNAYTDRDFTVYYDNFPADRLELVLDLESDRMRDLDLSAASLASEREVVKEERRLRVDNSIPGRLDEELWKAAFVAHPYRFPIVGWMEDLDRIGIEDCSEYFRLHYGPNHATLVLSGAFSTARARDAIERAYGDIPSRERPATSISSEPEQAAERRTTLKLPAQHVSWNAGWRVPAVGHPDVYVLDVLESILTGGVSSRLHHELVYERQVAISVTASFRWRVDPGLFELHAEMRPGRDGELGETLCQGELDRIAAEGVGDRELAKARNQLAATFARTRRTNEERAETLGTFDLWLADPNGLVAALEAYERVTAEDLTRVVRAYFRPENRTVITVVPEADASQALESEALANDRAHRA